MRISVKAKPSAREESVVKAEDGSFVVCVKEPPREGKANEAIARALAKHFGITRGQVILASGFSSRQKIFEISV
ncbi:MAG: DUF167 domain-containing protein [bacterium]|nr:DUF167 domain-containing protein [bacterium]